MIYIDLSSKIKNACEMCCKNPQVCVIFNRCASPILSLVSPGLRGDEIGIISPYAAQVGGPFHVVKLVSLVEAVRKNHIMLIYTLHQKLNGTESQRTPDQVSCDRAIRYSGFRVLMLIYLVKLASRVPKNDLFFPPNFVVAFCVRENPKWDPGAIFEGHLGRG